MRRKWTPNLTGYTKTEMRMESIKLPSKLNMQLLFVDPSVLNEPTLIYDNEGKTVTGFGDYIAYIFLLAVLAFFIMPLFSYCWDWWEEELFSKKKDGKN